MLKSILVIIGICSMVDVLSVDSLEVLLMEEICDNGLDDDGDGLIAVCELKLYLPSANQRAQYINA